MTNSTLAPPLRPEVAYLPAPFDDVRFTWDASDHYIKLDYFGATARLIECGAIEPNMADKTKGPKRRLDSAGHHFTRENRIIMREPISAALRIVRYISDPKFAETLPGVPKGLRFKRLDWLDSHPGTVHVTRDTYTTRTAGTRENLIAAGFPESYLRSKLLLKRPGYRVSLPWTDCPPGVYGHAHHLMRGYFEIDITETEKERKTPPPAPRSHLRLVVDNDNTVQP